ncbi:putative N-acyl-aliphatic-L-amino acid amidohydrolase [Dioscorea sansibarensis]
MGEIKIPFFLTLFLTGAAAAVIDAGVISRFQQYLQINTAHPSPDYPSAVRFLESVASSIAGIRSETLEFVPGKPLLLLTWPGRDPSLPAVLLYSHTDVVPAEPSKWSHHPFSAAIGADGEIFARGSQDMKCISMQHLEAARRLSAAGFTPDRTVYFVFSPDEEIGGESGAAALAASEKFHEMRVGVVLDEGLASPGEEYRVFYAERVPQWLVIKAKGAPGHGAKLYDGSAMQNLMKSVETIRGFRAAQFDMLKSGEKAEGEVVSVNFVFLKAGTPTPTGFVMNLQPSEAEVGLDIRVPPNVDIEALERRIAEEWAPSSRNMTFMVKQKGSAVDKHGKPMLTVADSSNPWWTLLEEGVKKANGKLSKPEIFPASTDARFFRELGLPAFGFSPMANTPVLLHDHNEFLKQDEYLKGIEVFESIIKTFASYKHQHKDDESRAEL